MSGRQKHVVNHEIFVAITDERLAEMIRAIDKSARDTQSTLHSLKQEQRRRRRAARQASR